jgi:hypothetical protein
VLTVALQEPAHKLVQRAAPTRRPLHRGLQSRCMCPSCFANTLIFGGVDAIAHIVRSFAMTGAAITRNGGFRAGAWTSPISGSGRERRFPAEFPAINRLRLRLTRCSRW